MRHRLRWAGALAVLVIWQGLVRRPTPPARGSAFNGIDVPASTQPGRDTLRVAAFNIAGGVSPEDNVLDLDRTAKYLHGFDLIGMEEVHGVTPTRWHNEAEIIGGIIHMPWLFAPSETRWWHEDFGNGALCSLPVLHWERFPLSTVLASSNRSLLRLTVQWHGRPLTVLITHLDRHIDHATELGAVRAAFYDAPLPAILMGDLNTEGPEPALNAMRSDPDVVDAIGRGQADNPLQPKLDWIFARGLRYVRGGLLANDASDHTLAWAEFGETAEAAK
jgi:endonuclease/exonuclease/phosphatase family metal-dependent hydrolase